MVEKRTKTAGSDATGQTGRSTKQKCIPAVEPIMCRLCWRFCECVPAFSHPPPVSPTSTARSSSSPQRTSELDPNTQTLTRQTGPLAFADSLNRRTGKQTVVRMHVAMFCFFSSSSACLCACLSLLCKVNPGVSLSCDVTLQPRSWEGEITTWLQVPLSVCARA